MAEERLQKILARAGIASRRKAESIITAGRVRVDGQIVTELGSRANPKKSTIELDGRRLEPEPLCYGVLHKPRAMVTTLSDPEGRPTARDILRQVGVRVVPVGRLDFNTSGALLFTNDGDFAQALSHAKGNVPKVYAAKVQKPIDDKVLERWAESIVIAGKKTLAAKVRILRREGDKTWLEVTLKEGKKHQVRALGEHAGTPVLRLARLSHAGIDTETLKPGQWRLLSIDELKTLQKSYGVPERLRGLLEPRVSSGEGRKAVQGRPSSKKPHYSTQSGQKKKPSNHRPRTDPSSGARRFDVNSADPSNVPAFPSRSRSSGESRSTERGRSSDRSRSSSESRSTERGRSSDRSRSSSESRSTERGRSSDRSRSFGESRNASGARAGAPRSASQRPGQGETGRGVTSARRVRGSSPRR
jgi:23S rRNA pseudouridine2605 synthase